MKRKELEEFKKRWEENLGGLGEMLNSPWFAVSIKYDEAEKNKCCICLLYTSPSPRDRQKSRMPSSA